MSWFHSPSRVILLLLMSAGLLACHQCSAYQAVNFDPSKVNCIDYFMDTVGTNDVQAVYLCRGGYDPECMATQWQATGSVEQAEYQCSQPQALSSSPSADCSVFRLTSPLDGLANGSVTFYWDPLPGATGYRLTVLDGGTPLASYATNSGQTSLTADVSSSAIGGGFELGVRLEAFVGPGVACNDNRVILRAAPAGGNNASPPVSGPVCGNTVCEPGEENGVCCTDCPNYNACIR